MAGLPQSFQPESYAHLFPKAVIDEYAGVLNISDKVAFKERLCLAARNYVFTKENIKNTAPSSTIKPKLEAYRKHANSLKREIKELERDNDLALILGEALKQLMVSDETQRNALSPFFKLSEQSGSFYFEAFATCLEGLESACISALSNETLFEKTKKRNLQSAAIENWLMPMMTIFDDLSRNSLVVGEYMNELDYGYKSEEFETLMKCLHQINPKVLPNQVARLIRKHQKNGVKPTLL